MASKVFIVTGASKGLGAAIVEQLLAQSHKVVVTARSEEQLQKFKDAHPGQVEYLAGDITSSGIAEKLVDLAVASFGRLDGVVINHGILEPAKLASASMDDIRRHYEINFFSYVAMAKASLDEVKKTKGCILWVSSGAALKPYVAWSTYGSSKAAVNSVAAHLAVEEPDITSITIGPGRVDTDMQATLRLKGKDTMDEKQYQSFVDAFQQGALLKPEQPGGVIAKFVANPLHELSGQYLVWNSPELAAYQA
ncbi:putative oxidoreductase [Trichoderma ghanense]|uniref:Oxidoreductase n=1 Tax=Trichoderma ghanense TaxID=65468 RepID=A0ABY2GZX0_9HYPO